MPRPANLHCFGDLAAVDLGRYRVLLWISDRAVPPVLTGYQGPLIIYRVGATK
jgi:hypothetical protein